ncbi:AfsR/SARP family transcriptional regulator [Nocardiopsis composta]|uniref:DNA-binding SARP family transcriptional activator n=1 Tax=Nocardiopsis composta TaxID=157465 RepID=A0A7W8VDY4_9ACTN|nr:AfsR/SARP family transcriptional regulator [Nocardiopsis composta]MBB5432535.1 DNA-binding SARP family transcriptional activator [Nocardiopsis composta]
MRFAVLGPLEVRDEEADRPVRLSPKLSGVLAALLSSSGAAVAEARLVDALWEGAQPRTAHKSLQVYVHHLRQALGGAEWIVREGRGYRLDTSAADVDAVRFAELDRRGRAAIADGDPQAGAELLREALGLWRGPAFSGLADMPLVREEAARLDERRWSAAEELARAELDLGRHAEVIAELTALVAEHPYRERLRAALMVALYRAGRSPEALEVYRRGRELLDRELGVEPGRELRDLESAILRGDASLDPPEASGPEGTAPAAPPRVPAQLPPDIPDFTGRELVLERILARLDDDRERAAPVVAISGMGGVGKTSLALHAAHARAADHPDGQLYVNLRGAEDEPLPPAQALAGLLHALGLEGAAVPDSVDDRAALYRTALGDRRVLVVLDDAASEAQVRPLLPGGSGASVLVTSRIRLTGLEGAHQVDLDVFHPEQAVELLGRIAGTRRVAAEPDAAADIARLCGYAPLAVRIAGARLAGRPQWRLARLARLLGDESRRLDELAAGDRQVRACFALSHRALDETARRAFRLLGAVEVPDFPEWVVAALLGVPLEEALEHTEALVDAQLLTIVEGPSGRLRYRMHDLIRLYARELGADDPERAAAVRRALGGWLWLAEQATEYIPGPCYATMHGAAERWPLPAEEAAEELRDPMAWFDGEWPAMAAAVRQACALGLHETAWDLAGCLEKYFDVRGRFDDWRRTHECAIAACRAAGNRRGEAVLRRGLADLNAWVGPGQAGAAMTGMLEQADLVFEMFNELDDARGMSDALVMRTWGLVSKGRPEEASGCAREALRLAEDADYLGGRARAYHVMAIAAYEDQRIDRAVDHLTDALELARLLGNSRFEATAMQFLGAAQCLSGQIETGRYHLLRSLEMARSMGDRYGEVFSLMYLTRLYIALGDPEALPTAESAARLSRRHGMNHHLADSLALAGEIHLSAGRVPEAVAILEESVGLWRTRGWPSFLADALDTLARAYDAASRPTAAVTARTEAARLRGTAAHDCL